MLPSPHLEDVAVGEVLEAAQKVAVSSEVARVAAAKVAVAEEAMAVAVTAVVAMVADLEGSVRSVGSVAALCRGKTVVQGPRRWFRASCSHR